MLCVGAKRFIFIKYHCVITFWFVFIVYRPRLVVVMAGALATLLSYNSKMFQFVPHYNIRILVLVVTCAVAGSNVLRHLLKWKKALINGRFHSKHNTLKKKNCIKENALPPLPLHPTTIRGNMWFIQQALLNAHPYFIRLWKNPIRFWILFIFSHV